MKTMEQFFNEIMANDELYENFRTSIKEDRLESFLKENGVSETEEEFEKFFENKLLGSGELTDEQLEAISGGGIFDYFKEKLKENYPKIYWAIDEAVYQAKKKIKDAVWDATH